MSQIDNHDNDANLDQSGLDKGLENGRREFLKKAGKFAVYVPPAVMLMSNPSKAKMLNSASGKVCNKPRRRNGGDDHSFSNRRRNRPGSIVAFFRSLFG